jgi:hypothetical protein
MHNFSNKFSSDKHVKLQRKFEVQRNRFNRTYYTEKAFHFRLEFAGISCEDSWVNDMQMRQWNHTHEFFFVSLFTGLADSAQREQTNHHEQRQSRSASCVEISSWKLHLCRIKCRGRWWKQCCWIKSYV